MDMVTSGFDDVAVNGCASVARLAIGSDTTRYQLAAHAGLVGALLLVVVGDLSVDTVTTAAVALAELTSEPVGQTNLTLCGNKASACPLALLAERATVPAESDTTGYQLLCLRRYW